MTNETILLDGMKKTAEDPDFDFFRDRYDLDHMNNEHIRRYISTKDLAKLQGDLRRDELKESINKNIQDRLLAEKLFILDCIKNKQVNTEITSQILYFEFDLETEKLVDLNDENISRIGLLIGGAYYFTQKVDNLKEKDGLKKGYLKISIKKNPENNDLYIENIDVVKDKNS